MVRHIFVAHPYESIAITHILAVYSFWHVSNLDCEGDFTLYGERVAHAGIKGRRM